MESDNGFLSTRKQTAQSQCVQEIHRVARMNIGDLVQSTDDSDLVGVIIACGDPNTGYFIRWLSVYKEGYVSYDRRKWLTLLSPPTETITASDKKCPPQT